MARIVRVGSDEVARIIESAEIVQVAEALGLHVDRRHRRPRRAICPFHDDSDPSLNLYEGGSAAGERDHYHCFVCGAHGDVVSLVQNYERVSFWEAVKRLARMQGKELPTLQHTPVDRRSGAAMVFDQIIAAPTSDATFEAFAAARGFDPLFLRRSGAGLINLRALADQARVDRAAEEKLVAAGIFRRDEKQTDLPDLYGTTLKGFFVGRRVVFRIADVRNETVGFAARSLADDTPKYLFSYDFPRRSTLYGCDRILAALQADRQNHITTPIEVYLVEGIFDVLRLEALGYHAAGILGSRIAQGQLECVKLVIAAARDTGRNLIIHISLDNDDAGRRGAYDLAISLLALLDSESPFELDVLWPNDVSDKKLDPDSWLKGLERGDAERLLSSAKLPVLAFLAALRLGADPHDIDWDKPGRLKLAAEARHIALALPQSSWARVLAPLDIGPPGSNLAEFAALIRTYGDNVATPEISPAVLNKYRDPADDRAELLSALTLGRSSTSRREYPLDDDAWERLAVAASPLFHLHRARLNIGDGPSAPLLSRELPKGEDRYRLKSGPVSEDALLQQYVLLELLRDRPECQLFATHVPAVRYSRDRAANGGVYRTGSTGERRALSFAYQIDMAIVNGDAPPRREGIFRPYFECWRSFIDSIDEHIKRFDHEDLQILRLDIAGFYDHVRRDIVSNALAIPLERALNILQLADGDTPSFAPLLRPDTGHESSKRAETVTEFLLSHCFGLSYLDPRTGEVKSHDPLRGIPQGPDLSAYIANISLFDLDDMVEGEVDRLNKLDALSVGDSSDGRCAAAYARYVDDLVLICRDLETAHQIRRKIESWLGSKGLSLNRKNPIPPPMSRAEARAWVTDNRAGFGFSGPLAELPSTDAMDPLADAGEIDRKTALGLLFDPELDDPTNFEVGLVKIGQALSAPDLRFNDRANAYRRLWCFAAMEVTESSGQALADAFWSIRSRAEPQLVQMNGLDIGLACFESLDRALRSNVPTGMLSDEACERFERNLLTLARGVLDDVFTSLAEYLLGQNGSNKLLCRYDVRCQVGIIACLAAQKLTLVAESVSLVRLRTHFAGMDADGSVRPLPEGLRLSLVKFDRFSVPVDTPLVVQGQSKTGALFAILNRTIVALQRVALHGEGEEPISYPQSLRDPNPVANLTDLIMGVWTPSDASTSDLGVANEVELDAAATLVNITYRNFVGVALRRPRLRHLIANTSDSRPLPSPPGLKTSGIMLWCGDGRLLLATTESNSVNPIGAAWADDTSQSVPGIRLRVANLPTGYSPLFLSDLKWTPAKIASLYRAGYPELVASLTVAGDLIPVPTAFSFFVRTLDGTPDLRSVRLVSWGAPRESVDGHAFIRNGSSLEAKKVYSEGADYWRYGWAVRDVCDRADLVTDDESGLDTNSQAALHREVHRREAIVARVLPRLSGADCWGPGEVAADKPIPTRIERALSLLEHFDASSSPEVDAAYLVAAMAEGIYMNERIDVEVDISAPGWPAALMVRSTRRLTRALSEAAKLWPTHIHTRLPYRRSAAAWQTMSGKVAEHISVVATSAVAPLANLTLGLEILAAVADLRALAFELAGSLTTEAIEQLEQCDLDPSWVSDKIGLDVILVDDEGHSVGTSLEDQARKLIETFCQILLGRTAGLSALRDRIAPAGWTVLVAILLQVAPLRQSEDRLRPRLCPMDAAKISEADAALRHLFIFFAGAIGTVETDDDWPWNAFRQLRDNRPQDIITLLRQLTDCASLIVTDEESWSNPRTGDSQSGRPVVRLGDGSSRSLADWQIDIAHIRGERGTTTEASSVGSRMRFRYSVSRRGDQVLGMHMVSNKLAKVAFHSTDNKGPTVEAVPLPLFEGKDAQAAPIGSFLLAMNLDAPNSITEKSGVDRLQGLAQVPHVERSSLDSVVSKEASSIKALRSTQQRSWSNRAKDKNTALRRVAIVQWDVSETYYHPGNKAGREEGLLSKDGKLAAKSDAVASGGKFLSTTEFRRRALLREVLASCLDFKVDGIVLPEYSVRPETVNWLARQIKQLGKPITIWCGTFRVAAGTQIDLHISSPAQVPFASAVPATTPAGRNRWDFHSALFTCLRATEGKDGKGIEINHFVRQKRFPSVAVGELIRPPADIDWAPLLRDVTDPFDIGTFALELVCSEMFPHASSANFIGVIDENEELAKRYGLNGSGETPFKYLSRDIYAFAKWTAYRNARSVAGDQTDTLVRGKALQRTLIILPAMTARSADYHIFGQNQYLAAGLVTAFCNAVTPSYGCGQSGFIGLDGWKVTEGMRTPYGSKAPGIFQLDGGKHSGPLGKAESAVVIADLDLLRTADQKPTPHYQSRALQLVAHLPIIFATEAGPGEGEGHYPNKQRRPRLRAVSNGVKSFEECAAIISRALAADGVWRRYRNIAGSAEEAPGAYIDAIREIREGLSLLECFVDDPVWMAKRTESFTYERYEFPPLYPLPALTDWIYVDDRWLPEPWMLDNSMDAEDALLSDRPILVVPNSTKDEPARKPG